MNIVVIAIDTLRADHLGCYGYTRSTSPHIDAFAEGAVVFDTHIATAIPTHPAFTTMATGQYSMTHGVVAHAGSREIPKGAPWLASCLLDAGYTTCAIDNMSHTSRLNFHRGFEYYIDPSQKSAMSINASNRELNHRALPWLDAHKDEPFFLFIHYWDPHTPYLPPRAHRTLFYKDDPGDPANTSLAGMERHPLGKTWREEWFSKLGPHISDAEYIVSLYDAEIRYCDEGVGQLLDKLDELGIAEDTAVILTADHGEMMYRHGIFFDHHGLYDGNLHIPFVIRCPGVTPKRLPYMTASTDFAPTVLGLAAVEVPEAMEGRDLAPCLRGAEPAPPHAAIVSQECTWQMKWSIRTSTHKFILARERDFYGGPMRELYDLRGDPEESTNTVEDDAATASDLEARLEDWIAKRMAKNGLAEDPLVSHGLSLGKQ